jgi:hypothetical protein
MCDNDEIAALGPRIRTNWRQTMKRAMNRAWLLPLAFAAALPLLGQEPKSEPKKSTDAETKAAPAETPATATASEAGGDSPLVAAAKRAKRRSRKASTTVITNETLAQSGAHAHVTTTERQSEIRLPSEPTRPTPEMVHAKNREKSASEQQRAADERAKAQAKEDEKRAQKAAAAEDATGDDADELLAGPEQKPPMH